ncbi:MAG: putative sulfate exporter family transporter, partial [Spirochaetia bacterium]|nr:putative sulfate exporter family transporter [Spirochaetia bacterium]
MKTIFKYIPGILLASLVALCGITLSSFIPKNLISGGVFSLLVGMLFYPLIIKFPLFKEGINFTGKKLLKGAIIGMGVTLSIDQVVHIGSFSLIVMSFTLLTAFGGGYVLGKFLKVPWRQSGLISAGTGICGGSAIAAIAPVIDASHE